MKVNVKVEVNVLYNRILSDEQQIMCVHILRIISSLYYEIKEACGNTLPVFKGVFLKFWRIGSNKLGWQVKFETTIHS